MSLGGEYHLEVNDLEMDHLEMNRLNPFISENF
jgi:hypothetical protein